MNERTRGLVVACLLFVAITATVAVIGATTGVVAPAMAAEYPADEEGLIVVLDEDGNAEVVMIFTYDLDAEEDELAFEALEGDAEERETFRSGFELNMQSFAEEAGDRTGRSMEITNATMDVHTTADTGVVTLSADWSNLAGTTGGNLALTEPFASGFVAEQPFRVVYPENGTLVSARPDPDAALERAVIWDTGSDLDGFELIVSLPVEVIDIDDTDDDADDDGAGFGFVLAGGALLVCCVAGVVRFRLNMLPA